MSYVLVGSPDKICLGSFLRFAVAFFPDYNAGEMHSLMSEESKDLYVSDFISIYPDGFLSYYAKRALNGDPVSILPKKAVEISDAVLWFDLWGTEPKTLKNSNGILNVVLGEWKKYIQALS